MSAEDILDLWLGEQHIGELRCVRGDDKIRVVFDTDYVASPARLTLGQAYLPAAPKREDVSSTRSLPHWFGHLLPAGRLRRLLAQRASVHPDREFYLLGALGNDLVGALRVVPRTDLRGAAPLPPDLAPIPDAEPLRFSLAGMMLKFSSVETEKGMTIPARGVGGRFIIKLPGAFPGLAENEDVVMTWAARAGINVPSHRTIAVSEIEGLPSEIEERGGTALVVERFDRPRAGGRIHQEDFAQVFSKAHHEIRNTHYEGNYDSIGAFILGRCGADDFDAFLRRLVFSTIAGNSDAHLKNWSVQYPDGIRPRLSPAYDLLFVGAYEGYGGERLALKVAGEDRFAALNVAHFEQLAKHAIKRASFVAYDLERAMRVVRESAEQAREAWHSLPEKERLSAKIRERLEAHQAGIKLP